MSPRLPPLHVDAKVAWQRTFTARVRSCSFLLRCSFSPNSMSSSEVVPSSSQGPSWGSIAAAPLPFGALAFVRAAGVSLYSLPSPAQPCREASQPQGFCAPAQKDIPCPVCRIILLGTADGSANRAGPSQACLVEAPPIHHPWSGSVSRHLV